MLITRVDKTNCDNLIRLLKRAKIELDGAEEILGAADVLRWTAALSARFDREIKDQDEKAKVASALATATVIPAPAKETAPAEERAEAKKEG